MSLLIVVSKTLVSLDSRQQNNSESFDNRQQNISESFCSRQQNISGLKNIIEPLTQYLVVSGGGGTPDDA